MRLLVDVYDAAGINRLGEGPIATATSASVKRVLDGAGSIQFNAPATDRRVQTLLANERQVRVWVGQDEGMRELGQGRLRERSQDIGEGGASITASGPDGIADLARKSLLLNRQYNDRLLSEIVADMISIVPGWTLTLDAVPGLRWSGRFDGGNVLKGLLTIAEQKGLHLRAGLTAKTLEMGAFGLQTTVQVLGAGDVTRDVTGNENLILIDRLNTVTSTQDVVNWLLPLGSGELSNVVTLADSTRDGPYPIEQTLGPDGVILYYIKHLVSIDTYGDEIQRVMKFDNIQALDGSEAARINAANALYDAAVAWLDRNAFEEVSYQFSGVKPRQTVRPGDRIRLTYRGYVYSDNVPTNWVEIDDWFWVIGVSEKVSGDSIAVDVEISTMDRHRQDAALALVKTMEAVELLKFSGA